MKLALVSTYDPHDMRQWSGIPWLMHRALRSAGKDVAVIAPVRGSSWWRGVARAETAVRRVGGARHLWERDPRYLKSIAADVDSRIRALNPDIVLSIGTLPLAYAGTAVPTAFWADATFATMVDFYPEFSRLSRKSVAAGHAAEQGALDRSAAGIYTSAWAARSAEKDYRMAPDRLAIVPFGSSIAGLESEEEAARVVGGRERGRCRLLFVSTDWRRKGGDTAVQISAAVADAGLDVELFIVGLHPPLQRLPGFVRTLGWIDKRDDAAVAELRAAFGSAHFLVVPAMADATAITLSDAAAFAVPVVGSDVGGVRSVVRDGVNGLLMAPDAPPEQYAAAIIELWTDPRRYRDAAMSAYREYATRLNWKTSVERVWGLLSAKALG